MRNRSKASIGSRTRPRRLPCERFRPNEPERHRLGTLGALNPFEFQSRKSYPCKVGRTNPSRVGGGPARWTGQPRQRAYLQKGSRHRECRHFPQTKPISANEANLEKGKRDNAP